MNHNYISIIDLEKEDFGEEEKQENKDKTSYILVCPKTTNVDLVKSSLSLSSRGKRFHFDTALPSYLHYKYLDPPPDLFLA